MNRPSRKEIRAAVEKLRDKTTESAARHEDTVAKPESKKTSQRIRKKGV